MEEKLENNEEQEQSQEKIKEILDSLVGKIIGTSVKDQFVGFGILQTDGTHYGWGNFGFLPSQVEKINRIDVLENINEARANIVFKYTKIDINETQDK